MMGTNYYVRTPPCPSACEHCDASQRIHLGKGSIGWQFSFRADPDWHPEQAYAEWVKLAQSGTIEDEHGHVITLTELLAEIDSKRDGQSHVTHEPDLGYRIDLGFWYRDNGYEFCTRPFS